MSLFNEIVKGVKSNARTIVKCVAITLATAFIGGIVTGIASGLEEVIEDGESPE